MKPYVLDYANDIVNGNKQNTMMRDDMRKKIEEYIEAALEDYKHGLISVDEIMYILSQKNNEAMRTLANESRVNHGKRGRPRIDQALMNKAIELYESGEYTMKEVVEKTGIGQATIFKRIREKRNKESNEHNC